MLDELRSKEAEFDVLSDESQELIASSGELRISMGTSQLVSRYQSMLLTCKVSTFCIHIFLNSGAHFEKLFILITVVSIGLSIKKKKKKGFRNIFKIFFYISAFI